MGRIQGAAELGPGIPAALVADHLSSSSPRETPWLWGEFPGHLHSKAFNRR
jgi:hypothetical protein